MLIPTHIQTIIDMRAAGEPETVIAKALGMTRKVMWNRVARWNTANPEHAVPRPQSRPVHTKFMQVTELVRAGKTPAEVAAALGWHVKTARVTISHARKVGALPRLRAAKAFTGRDTYRQIVDKGGAPPMGTVGNVLTALTPAEVNSLLGCMARTDATLADTLARIVKEHLDAIKTDPR